MKHFVELEDSILDKYMLEDMTRHYHWVTDETDRIPMYSHNPIIEKKYRRKLAKAFKRVIEYYGGDFNAKDV